MPSDFVMPEFKAGKLHSGSKTGPVVKNRKQAVAILLAEKRKEGKRIPDRPASRQRGIRARFKVR